MNQQIRRAERNEDIKKNNEGLVAQLIVLYNGYTTEGIKMNMKCLDECVRTNVPCNIHLCHMHLKNSPEDLNCLQHFIDNEEPSGEDGRFATCETIGERMGLTRQRVSQIEISALRKMRKFWKENPLEKE